MRVVIWTIRVALFILLLAFAARNTEPATLRFYFDLAWQAPLVLMLLAFFAGGVLLGVLATAGTLLRQRREISRLRREARAAGAERERASLPPPPAEG